MLTIDRLDVFYGYLQALKEVSLKVAEGEVVTIVGANGAGKTTLLRTVCGLLPAKRGSIFLEGKEISRTPTERISRLGISMVPEGREVFGALPVADNLLLGAYSHLGQAKKEEVQAWQDEVYQLFPILKERRKQLAGTLSGGEQQMLAIGRALMARPRILLMDEPSLGLAPLVVKEIFRVVAELHEKGIAILLVEQNAKQALHIADRGYVMETGRIVIEGSREELMANENVKRAYLGG